MILMIGYKPCNPCTVRSGMVLRYRRAIENWQGRVGEHSLGREGKLDNSKARKFHCLRRNEGNPITTHLAPGLSDTRYVPRGSRRR